MRIERIENAAAPAHVERESELGATCSDAFLVVRHLLGRCAVLLCDVLDDVLALRRHLRIELERLEMNFGASLGADALERLLERGEPDRTPGAGDIGNEVDLERSRCHAVAWGVT